MSGISQVVLGLWDGKDSGIWSFYHGTLGTLAGISQIVWDGKDSGIWALYWGYIWVFPSSPRTLGWEGQWD